MSAVTALAAAPASPRDHIVDVLIAERAPTLSRSWAWPLARPALYAMLSYGKARRMADQIAPLPGGQALDAVSGLLSLKVEAAGLEHLPKQGRVVIIANHPTGIADGIALYDAVKPLRPDICFYANSDAHRVAARFDEVLIPVEWVEAKRTRERTRLTLQLTREAMEAERALAIFPAGRLARMQDGVLRDPEWMTSAVSIARKYEAPVLPLHVSGPRSTLFHLFDKVSGELRDMTLFHELLNKRGRRFSLRAGPLIPPEALAGDAGEVSERIKTYIEDVLPTSLDRRFV
ncbi:MAG: 1-acyl-sn-glycerol-3-phosphate acyltransferase [Caulobacteraceae bacterium]|nr:1-acyl-sn-glycerol-3-phosphate acyltransferase [Caulobacteraceae bacterium]